MMHPLLTILRAAHCRSTHHYFAIDALPLVQTDAGKRLVSHLLRHHDRYLVGTKDPDVRFRDFQNHVIHVEDGYWGGAPRVAHQWYDRLQRELDRGRYAEAAYAAGVLSHYFTDPIQPLHTATSDREAVIHRPIEWSIHRAYDAIWKQWQDDELRIVFQLSDSVGWLGEAILHAARFAHRKYGLLVDSYRLEESLADPPAGLTAAARLALSELFGLAVTGWARVLERAAADAEARLAKPLPTASITAATVMAGLRVPTRLWLRRCEHRAEQQHIVWLVEEYLRTGSLQEHLPAEVDVKRRVAQVYENERRYREQQQAISDAPVAALDNASVVDAGSDASSVPVTLPFVARPAGHPRLMMDDPLCAAPSIGPKTAAKFAALGVATVGEFLDWEAEDLVERVAVRWITTDTIRQWQAQARLMSQLEVLRAADARLLVGAGYATPESLLSRPADALFREVCRFAARGSGLRQRQSVAPPTREDVLKWYQSAASYCRKQTAARRSA